MQYFDEYQDIPIIRRVVDDEKLRQLAYDDYLRNQGPERTYTVPFLLEVTRPVLQDFTKLWFSMPLHSRACLEMGLIVPVSILSFSYGLSFPDLDIPILGIGWHRYFLLHGALGAYISREFFRKYHRFLQEPGKGSIRKLTGTCLAAGALGIGVHLLADGSFSLLDGEKSVVFGIPGIGKIGTLVPGTMIDDNLYLLGNSFWAFKIARDIAVITFAEDLDSARGYVQENFKRISPGVFRTTEISQI